MSEHGSCLLNLAVHVFGVLCCPIRKALEEKQHLWEGKRLKTMASIESFEEDVKEISGRFDKQTKLVATWTSILAKMVSPEHHQECTNHEMRWIEFFRERLDEDVEDPPYQFLAFTDQLPFHEAIVVVSTHIAALRKDLGKFENMLSNRKKKQEQKKARVEGMEKRWKRKADEKITMHETGEYVEVLNSHKSFG